MARPSHRPDPALRRQVDIGRVIGIDPKTLRKHNRDELDSGYLKSNAKVTENLYRKATGEGRESVGAAIFWLAADRDLARRRSSAQPIRI